MEKTMKSNLSTIILNLAFFITLLVENYWKHEDGSRSDEIAFLMYLVVLGSFLFMIYQIIQIVRIEKRERSESNSDDIHPFEQLEHSDLSVEERVALIREQRGKDEVERLEIPDFLRRKR